MPVENDFGRIRSIEGSQQKAFEELCCQLAKDCAELRDPQAEFIAKGDPDAGVECLWRLSNGDVIGWQAKYFTSPLGDSQWRQIDSSVETALEKHPNLTKYVICIPLDRQDPRIEEENWFMDKWEDHVEEWEKWDSSVSFEYWGRFELNEFLSQDQQRGRRYFWFEKDDLTFDKIRSFANRQISNAHTRYNPDLDVSLPIENLFSGLCRTAKFTEDIDDRKERLERLNQELKNADYIEDNYVDELSSGLERTVELIEQPESADQNFPIERIEENTTISIDKIEQLLPQYREEKNDYEHGQGPSRILDKIWSELGRTKSFFNSNRQKLANRPTLYVRGEAGVGKTHLFCDITESRIEKEKPTLLFLGEHFTKGDIWKQMIEQLGLDCTREELLGALDTFGEMKNERVLILIDGLNESEPREIWRNQLNGILRETKRYPFVGIAISCRTGYEQSTVPEFEDDLAPIQVLHGGFQDREQEAAKTYFEYYGLEAGSVPLLIPEFSKPLFLKLFCEALQKQGETQVPHGVSGINSLFESYVSAINDRLAEQLDYDPSEDLVESAIHELASLMADRTGKYLSKELAKKTVNQFLPDRRKFSESLYYGLLKEDLLVEQERYDEKDTEYVRFQFEKFADHYIVSELLETHFDPSNPEASFEPQSELHNVFVDTLDTGLLESLAIHLPEKYGIEIFEMVEGKYVLDSFLKSLAWRDPDTLREKGELKEDVENYIFENLDSTTQETLFDTLILVAGNEDHPMNAEYLHQLLQSLSTTDRDLHWSTFLHRHRHEGAVVDRLISWSEYLDEQDSLTLNERRLYGTALCWFFTTSCRPVRDRATKGLVNVFDDEPGEIKTLLEKFDDIDDLYVKERVFGAAYGVVLRNPKHESIPQIASFVFENEFENGKPTPHLLLRDYARGIVETTIEHHGNTDFCKDRIKPGFDCDWPFEPPSVEELETLRSSLLEKAESEDASDQIQSAWGDLVGRDGEGAGWSDFSRYIVGTNTHSEFGHFDCSMAEGLRWIVKRMVDLGWDPNRFATFDRNLKRRPIGHRGTKKPETLRKKYQWISYHQLIAFLCDNSMKMDDGSSPLFEGPWQLPYRRDIDPSVLSLSPQVESEVIEDFIDYDCRAHTTEINEWVADSDEYPEIESLLQFQQNSNEFIPLYQYLSQIVDIEREDNRRKFFCHAYGYIIDRSERDEFTSFIEDNWVTKENIGLSELRDTPSLTDVFLGEYPWHPSARYQSRSIDESPTDATKLAVDLNWESEYDTSTQGAYNMLVPSSEFYNEFELKWDFDNYHLIDRNSELEIFDPTSLNKEDSWSQSTLLASKKPLLSQLESKQKTIVWSILGEKNVLGWSQSEHLGYVRIRGVYWIEDGEITGVDEGEFVESGDSPSGEAHSVPEDVSNVNVDFDGTDDFELVVRETLEDIEGIGPKKAEKLRKAGFEDLPDVQGAARDELLSVEGIGPKLVDRLQETSTLSYLFKEVDSGKFQSN